MVKTKFWSFLYCLLFAQVVFLAAHKSSYAQCSNTLTGHIIESKSQLPVAFAQLHLMPSNVHISSDSVGHFNFTSLCPGNYTLRVISLYKESFTFSLQLKVDTVISLNCTSSITQLVTVNVNDGNKLREQSPINTHLNSEQIEQNHGQSFAELMSATTEATVLKTGSNISKPVVNGMHGYRLLLFNNDIKLEGQQWGQEHAPELDPYLAHSIILIKGAATLQYGHDAMAGVILMESKPLHKISKPIMGQLNTSVFTNGRGGSSALVLEGKSTKIKGFYWRTQGSIKRMGDLNTPDYFLQNTGVKEYNFALTTGYFHSKWNIELFYSQFNAELGILKGSHIGNLTDLKEVLSSDRNDTQAPFSYVLDRPKQNIEHELFKVTTNYYLNSFQTLTFTAGRQYNYRTEYDLHIPRVDSIAVLNQPQLQYELVTYSGDLAYKYTHKRGTHQLGIQGNNMTNVYEGRFFIPNYIQNTIGVYVTEQIDLKKWNFGASARIDHKNLTSYFWQNNEIVSPNRIFAHAAYAAEAAFKPNEKIRCYLNVSNTWRAPSVNELYSNGLHHGTASFEQGNAELTVEQQYQVDMGFNYTQKNTSLRVAPFASIINNYINITPTLTPVLTIQGAFPAFEYQQTDVVYRGVTAVFNQNWLHQHLQLNVRGTFLRVYEKETKTYIFGIPSDQVTTKITYNFDSKNADTSKVFSNSTVSAQWLWVDQQSLVNPIFDYAPPPTSYHLFSLHFSTNWNIRNQTIALHFGIENLFNTTYKDYMNRLRYFSNEMGCNLSIRINYKF